MRPRPLATTWAGVAYRATSYDVPLWVNPNQRAGRWNYHSFELAEAAGFAPEALVEDDLQRCQAEADWLVDRGIRGIVAPSAALPGSTSLTLFGPRVPVRWNSIPALASAIPGGRTCGSRGTRLRLCPIVGHPQTHVFDRNCGRTVGEERDRDLAGHLAHGR
jgi:hypothetical protein